jgi:hypothetical protein
MWSLEFRITRQWRKLAKGSGRPCIEAGDKWRTLPQVEWAVSGGGFQSTHDQPLMGQNSGKTVGSKAWPRKSQEGSEKQWGQEREWLWKHQLSTGVGEQSSTMGYTGHWQDLVNRKGDSNLRQKHAATNQGEWTDQGQQHSWLWEWPEKAPFQQERGHTQHSRPGLPLCHLHSALHTRRTHPALPCPAMCPSLTSLLAQQHSHTLQGQVSTSHLPCLLFSWVHLRSLGL